MMTRRRTNGSSLPPPPLNIAKGARHIEQEYQVVQETADSEVYGYLDILGFSLRVWVQFRFC